MQRTGKKYNNQTTAVREAGVIGPILRDPLKAFGPLLYYRIVGFKETGGGSQLGPH